MTYLGAVLLIWMPFPLSLSMLIVYRFIILHDSHINLGFFFVISVCMYFFINKVYMQICKKKCIKANQTLGHPQTVDIPHNCGELSSYIALGWNYFWMSIFLMHCVFKRICKNESYSTVSYLIWLIKNIRSIQENIECYF